VPFQSPLLTYDQVIQEITSSVRLTLYDANEMIE
jgi:hypothetical protein